jgi:glycosyltransferase involved in cell wall biosynthesis
MAGGEVVRISLAAKQTQIPILMQLQDVEFGALGGPFEDLGSDVRCIANSCFTAEKCRKAYGVDPKVIHPFIVAGRYKTKTTRGNVTFINPHPVKGRDIALGIARLCPEIPFTFVESWELSDNHRRQLTEKLTALPNVTLLPPRNDMRGVYGKCKILLVPSIWEEGYGRVVTEAQISGIPVIASRCGGLPESVGSGGILFDPDGPIDIWVAAVRKLWLDHRSYGELSAAALAYAARSENSLSQKLDLWNQALLNPCGAPSSSSPTLPASPQSNAITPTSLRFMALKIRMARVPW